MQGPAQLFEVNREHIEMLHGFRATGTAPLYFPRALQDLTLDKSPKRVIIESAPCVAHIQGNDGQE